jgi:NADPH2:quinone reductase
MKAIRVHQFGGPEVLELEEVPDPKPARGQVVVRVKAVGVNPVETYIRAGNYARKPALPYTPGTDAAGIVDSAGEGVTRVKVGDRVYTHGTISGVYTELALCEEAQVHVLPTQVMFAQGAALGIPYATAYRALFQRARAIPGETVLVHGASGGVGVAAVQFARAAGLTVIGTAGTERGRKLVAEQGAHRVLDHHVLNYLDGLTANVVIEMLANVNLGKDLTVLAPHGRVVIVGNRGAVEVNPREVMARDAAILGMVLFNASQQELAEAHAAIVTGLQRGELRPVVGKDLPLAEASRAHELVMEPGSYGKIVLVP